MRFRVPKLRAVKSRPTTAPMVGIRSDGKPIWLEHSITPELLVRIQRMCPDRKGRYFYDSSNYVFWLQFKSTVAVIFEVRRNRVRRAAFSSGLSGEDLRAVIDLMRDNGLENWVTPGIDELKEFILDRSDVPHKITTRELKRINMK